jgi:hypothetical protein
MSTGRVGPQRREAWRYVARAVVTLGAVVAIGYWALVSLVIAALKCDDTCGGADVEHWRWTGQLVLAAVGCIVALTALALGFSAKRRRLYRTALVASASLAAVWVAWVVGFGEF